MKMRINKQNCFFDIVFIVLFAVFYIIPSIRARLSFIMVLAAAIAYVLYYVIIEDGKLSGVLIAYIVIIILEAFLYAYYHKTGSISSAASNMKLKKFMSRAYLLTLMFLPVLFTKRIVNHATEKQIIFLLIVSYVLFAYVMFVTMRELSVNSSATRDWSEFAENSEKNVADYNFVYAVPFVPIMLSMFVFNTKNVFIQIAELVLILLFLYFLFKVQYTLAILITVICCGIGMVMMTSGLKRLLIIFAFIFIVIFTKIILEWLLSVISSKEVYTRFYEIYSFLFGGESDEYNLNGRMTLYFDTFKAFLQSPIYGNRKLHFDGHATFLTILADYGVMGGVPFYYMFFRANKDVRSTISGDRYFIPIFIALLLMGFTNPIHAAIPLMYTVWFLMPLSLHFFNKGKRDASSINALQSVKSVV